MTKLSAVFQWAESIYGYIPPKERREDDAYKLVRKLRDDARSAAMFMTRLDEHEKHGIDTALKDLFNAHVSGSHTISQHIY